MPRGLVYGYDKLGMQAKPPPEDITRESSGGGYRGGKDRKGRVIPEQPVHLRGNPGMGPAGSSEYEQNLRAPIEQYGGGVRGITQRPRKGHY